MGKLFEKRCDRWTQDSVRLIHTPSALARSTLLYIQEAGDFKTMPPYSTERANLPSFLLIFTRKGKGILELDGGRWELSAGSCMFVDCMQHHRYFAAPGGWEFLWLHFNGNAGRGYHSCFAANGPVCAQIPQPDVFAGLLRECMRLQQERTVRADICINACIVQLLTQLLLACHETAKEAAVWPDYIRRAVAIIDRRFFEPLTLEQLAQECGVSRFYLSREFKRQLGINFAGYLTRVRLMQAKQLLRFTDRTVGCIAQECGFNDASYFIRLFRKNEGGLTPRAYRLQWGREE